MICTGVPKCQFWDKVTDAIRREKIGWKKLCIPTSDGLFKKDK